jgi:hypothetical protein
MNRVLRKKLLIGLAAVAVIAGVTAAAVMAAQPAARHHRRGPLATAAGYLGVSSTQLRSELRSGKSLAEIADATAGKSEAGLIAALEAAGKERLTADAAKLPSVATAEVERVGGPSAAHTFGGGGEHGRVLATAASYLGVSAAHIRAQLLAGRTLAQITEASAGKSVAGLIEALVTARKAALAKALAAGKITQAQANVALPRLTTHATAEVDRVHARHSAHARQAAAAHRHGARSHRARVKG